jgi:hypothetical protein
MNVAIRYIRRFALTNDATSHAIYGRARSGEKNDAKADEADLIQVARVLGACLSASSRTNLKSSWSIGEVDAAIGERSVAVVRTAVRGHYDFMKSHPASLPQARLHVAESVTGGQNAQKQVQ